MINDFRLYSIFTLRVSFILSICFCTLMNLSSQSKQQQIKVIQFSGMVFYEDESGAPAPLPYTNVAVKGTNRGSSANVDGFFSFVALANETIVFSRIGYRTIEIKIPDTLRTDQYKWIQIMSEDDILLPEAIIMPWPSKDNFKQEFLAIDITDELRENAMANLAEEKLRDMRYTLPYDGSETTKMVIRQQATDYIYTGQIKPQNIFNPLAWKKFIDAWRRGDFKKKKK
jgi:CarboxypepD_reg-like domain